MQALLRSYQKLPLSDLELRLRPSAFLHIARKTLRAVFIFRFLEYTDSIYFYPSHSIELFEFF